MDETVGNIAHVRRATQFVIKLTVNVQQILKNTSKLAHMTIQIPTIKAFIAFTKCNSYHVQDKEKYLTLCSN